MRGIRLRTIGRQFLLLPLDLIRLLVLLLFLLWRFFLALIFFLLGKGWLRRREDDPRKCPTDIPGHIRRKPDPCLYSQSYLMQQGIPVTWDNPDIQLIEEDGTPVDSSQLLPDHPY